MEQMDCWKALSTYSTNQLFSGWSLVARPLKLAARLEFKTICDKWRNKMKLSPPKQATWIVALALAVLALLGHESIITGLNPYAFWLALVAAALLLIATIVKGL
jgi:hypothetical protein